MQLRLIRNATLKLSYAGRTVLVDPYFAPRHSLPSYTGRSANPLVDLPVAVDDIIDGVELVIISHLHSDHFDSVAKQCIAKSLPILCQPGDEDVIRAAGFTNVTPLEGTTIWQGIAITRRKGSHGLGPVLDKMGSVMGFSLDAPDEPGLYWAGDSVLYPPVTETIAQTRPQVIVTHSCSALWDGVPIVMDAAETVAICRMSPGSVIVATHMESLDHATVSRLALRQAAQKEGITADRLLIPADGETLSFAKASSTAVV
ncbi:MAG: MBL fold metallo-hydrolase [Rhizobium sp.]